MNKISTVMEIDTKAFKHNIEEIKKYTPKHQIMPIIKANAYGTYLNKEIELVKEFDIVGVAKVDEGIKLREIGYKNNILILNQPDTIELNKIIEYNLTIGISSKEFLNSLKEINKELKVHLEIETGMNRTGINLSELEEYILKITNNKNIIIEGIYTHLSSADNDEEYTKKQLEIFDKAISLTKNINTIKYIHALASSGILNYLSEKTNTIRPGILLYGYYPSIETITKLDLIPVTKLKTKITFLKTVEKNTSISYSRTYITETITKVATIPIGYADGLKRMLSNKGYVVINDKKCKIIGNICMDSCMIDVTNIENVKVGDEVYIWDNKIITVDEIAKLCDTINYEIISTIGERVPRIFV